MAIKKILVVDDSSTDRLAMKELLESHGFEVVTAESGEEGLLKTESEMPDMVLMDVVMPGMTGFQATRAITKNPKTSTIPVIVCTGKSQATDKAWALKMGARECLAKPLNATDLLAEIKKLG